MKFIFILAIIAAVVVFTQGPFGSEPSIAVDQTGYFKDDRRNRILAYYTSEPLSRDEVDTVVEGQIMTDGAIARLVFYSGTDNPAPADILTLAPTIQRALELTVTPPFDDWDWMVLRNPAGEMTFKENQN